MTRDLARRLCLGAAPALCAIIAGEPACYSAGGGTAPPPHSFYFPVGLAVSTGGSVLYAVNSDFDLQWNGGTLQSYDLTRIRHDAAQLIGANLSGTSAAGIPFVFPPPAGCQTGMTVSQPSGARIPPGQACAPPVDSTHYVEDSVIIGAFATDLQLSPSGTRLFAPVRGDATLTWADVVSDSPAAGAMADPARRFALDCGTRVDGRCDTSHHTGSDPNECGDSRGVTMPGEPFGMAQTPDGTAIAITHQTDTKTSLLVSGLGQNPPVPAAQCNGNPSMQFVLDGLPTGGNGIAAVPHDPNAVPPPCENNPNNLPCVRPAFLQTSRTTAELDLIRYYDDDGSCPPGSSLCGSSLHRPFLVKEVSYSLNANAGGADSRGIVIDPSPRLACAAQVTTDADKRACAQRPARVFFANRTPPSLVIGEIGEPSPSGDGSYDPDLLRIPVPPVPLPDGPSRVYLAPIVDSSGRYALRVFVVCFDSATIRVYDPEVGAIEATIDVGPGPYAMAFDPFCADDANRPVPCAKSPLQDVATHQLVPPDANQDPALHARSYRFAYVASFTESYVQVIDLDQTSPATYENVVFTLGQPTKPKGT